MTDLEMNTKILKYGMKNYKEIRIDVDCGCYIKEIRKVGDKWVFVDDEGIALTDPTNSREIVKSLKQELENIDTSLEHKVSFENYYGNMVTVWKSIDWTLII